MENPIENLSEKAKELESVTSGTNLALSEMRIQFETLAEMQKEERIETQKMHNEAIEKIMERHAKELAHWKHIAIGLILTLAVFIGGVVGIVGYFLANFDIQYGYVQDASIGGDGTTNIFDGLHINGD